MKKRFAEIMQNIRRNSSNAASVLLAAAVTAGALYSLSKYTAPKLYGQTAGQEETETVAELLAEQESEAVLDTEEAPVMSAGSFMLQDGIYTGSADGFAGTITVSVELKEHTITDIKILESADDAAFFTRAKEGVISEILTAQTTQVDTVSGATYSSKGIINAVKNALSAQDSPKEENKTVSIGNGSFPLEDGFYQGVGNGYAGEIRVLLEMKDHTITQLIILKSSDDANYFARAKEGVTAAILEKQTADVDCVSGATYSSRGIMEAVKNALNPETAADTAADKTVDTGKTTIGQGAFQLKNGVYKGSGTGYRGKIRVAVVIKDASIIAVEPYDYADDAKFFARAKEGVTASILEKQTTKVDTVSGATYSSKGILAAVADAIKKGKSGSNTDDGQKKTDETPVTYKDGSYTGSADGFAGEVRVKVRIRDGKIDKVTVLSHHDDDTYMSKAKALTKSIVQKQTTGLDAVSGATYSSNGILKAVENALKKAVEGKTTEEEEPSQTPAAGKFDYPDGIYEGVGSGYGGDIKVSVVILDQTLKAVLVTDHAGEDDSFFNRAKTITTAMVSTQDINVDAVSGATYSSNGILDAVRAAIEAAKNGVSQNTGSDTKKPEDDKTPAQDISQEQVYYGVVACEPDEDEDFTPYNLHVRVTFSNGRIASVTDVYGDGSASNNGFITRAVNGSGKNPGIASQLTEKNRTEGVDTVSGATCTSKALLEAVKILLTAAEKDGCYVTSAE